MIKRRYVIRYFNIRGFNLESMTKHDKLAHPDGRWTTLKRQSEIDDRLFELMKKQAGIKDDERK